MWLWKVLAEIGILLNDMAVGVDYVHGKYSLLLVDHD
jgi:hypothetical protein